MAQAFKEEELGFYYSHNQDWSFLCDIGVQKTNQKGEEVEFYYCKDNCLPQVNEITTQYGEIAII
ncbi:hypothetical protein [Maribacter sp. ACAM166]|uniref:hypothetical protein n=1 Tax=Maribacter sp. ACAM166 TaxID=2508996 RepID=UPI0010FE605D|nr:hypothetical protein [Maribacter sp. ACAM166]TLP71939.1 hypothetical protein ES765_18965 [Maribacter sp. ACAM166]